ncbi:MAG: hypothetical protein H7257_12585 [Taibaiella sp.]|nr:hypothetical protein [Taibaiella sp.]
MGKLLLLFIMLLCGGGLAAQEAAPVKPDYSGTYSGSAWSTDSALVLTELELIYGTDSTGTFSLRDKYTGKKGPDIASRIKGEYTIAAETLDGHKVTLVTLSDEQQNKIMYYLLKAGDILEPLDDDKHTTEAAATHTLKKKL